VISAALLSPPKQANQRTASDSKSLTLLLFSLKVEAIRPTNQEDAMRKTSLITAILLLSAVWAVAQSTPSTPPQSTTPSSSYPSTAPSQSTTPDTSSTTTQTTTTKSETSSDSTAIEGCLSGSSGSYTLTDQSGKAWQLAGDTSKLTEHVGHQVRVMGSDGGSSAASSSSGNASASGGSGASAGAASTFTVKKVKMISSSCSTSK
jgi:hypothetical protein